MFQNKLHSGVDPNTLSIDPLFEASKRGKRKFNTFQYKLEGAYI